MPNPLRCLALACSLAAALTLAPRQTRAQVQGCGDDADDVDGDVEVTPEDGAERVALNAPIVVRYASDVDLDALRASVEDELEADEPVPCAGELACVLETEPGTEPRAIDAELAIEGHTLRLSPREPLAPSAEHTVLIVQPGLDIVARQEASFRTGTRSDREPPELSYSAEDVSVSVTELPPECRAPAGSRRVVLELPPATDDGDAESVTLEVVVLADDESDDGELRARAANEGDPVLVSFLLSPQEAERRVCLEVHARDALGQRADREPRVCFNPSTRPLFSSACTAMPGGPRNKSWGGLAWFLLLALLARAATQKAV